MWDKERGRRKEEGGQKKPQKNKGQRKTILVNCLQNHLMRCYDIAAISSFTIRGLTGNKQFQDRATQVALGPADCSLAQRDWETAGNGSLTSIMDDGLRSTMATKIKKKRTKNVTKKRGDDKKRRKGRSGLVRTGKVQVRCRRTASVTLQP